MWAGLPQRGQVCEVPRGFSERKRMPKRWLLYLKICQISERMVVLLRQLRHLPRTPLPRPVDLRVLSDSPLMRAQPYTEAKSKSRLAARCASSRLRASYTCQQRLISCS